MPLGPPCDCRRDCSVPVTVELPRSGPVTMAVHLPESLIVPVDLVLVLNLVLPGG